MKDEKLICPNNACKRVIPKPLTTSNLQQSSKKSYYACPYCLTEITIIETETKNPPRKAASEIATIEEKPNQNQKSMPNCNHYFGYMNEKEHKQQMPEECMLCSQIIECMQVNGSAKEASPT